MKKNYYRKEKDLSVGKIVEKVEKSYHKKRGVKKCGKFIYHLNYFPHVFVVYVVSSCLSIT